jgi:hypothetical protein
VTTFAEFDLTEFRPATFIYALSAFSIQQKKKDSSTAMDAKIEKLNRTSYG